MPLASVNDSSSRTFLRRTNNRSRRTAPKSRTNSVAKTGFEGSPVNPTFRLKPNPSLIPRLPTPPQLPPPPRDPDQNPTSVPPHCLQTPTGALLRWPITAIPKHISPPKVSRPPYQVSSPALPPLFFPYVLRSLTPHSCSYSIQQPSYRWDAVSQLIPRTDPEPPRFVSSTSFPVTPQPPRFSHHLPPH